MEGNVSVTGNANVADYVSYAARGHSLMKNGAFQAGSITVCDNRSDNVGRSIVVSNAGRVRVVTGVSCS